MLLAIWGLTGLAGLLRPANVTFVARVLFPLGALCGVALAIVAAASITAVPERVTLAIGLPDLPFHLVHSVVHDEMCGMDADSQDTVRVPISTRVSH